MRTVRFLMKGLNKLADDSRLHNLKLAVITAALSAGMLSQTSAALAETNNVSEAELLKEAVALYEKLSGKEVEVPQSLTELCNDEGLGKAIILGFANADEINEIANSVSLRKQDAMTVLYKTIIDFDDSFALSYDEVDEYLNKCCDNALIDEENRVGYAFMIKHGIILTNEETEPNKTITWESCNILTDVLYNFFVREAEITVGDTAIQIGANADTVTDALGEPDRITESGYDFDWYVYNKNYSDFVMVGMYEDRICALFTNSSDFSFGDIKSGDDYLLTYKYALDSACRFYEGKDGKLDAFMYNPRIMNTSDKTSPLSYTAVLADLINANRAGNGDEPIKLSAELLQKAQDMASQPKYIELSKSSGSHIADRAQHETAGDIFSVYAKLLKSDSDVFSKDVNILGIGTVTDGDEVSVSILSDSADSKTYEKAESDFSLETLSNIVDLTESTSDSNAYIEAFAEQTDINEKQTQVTSLSADGTVAVSEREDTAVSADVTEESTEGDSVSDEISQTEVFVRNGDDFVISTPDSEDGDFLVKIYSFEDDKYIVNSFIKAANSKITLNSELFTAGKDYSVSVSSADGSAAQSEFIMSYGEAAEDAVKIITPEMNTVSDNDFIALEWASDIYSDFAIDIYNEDGQLLISQPVSEAHKAKISNVEPGNYYIYVSAVRRGDKVVKAQANVNVTVEMPAPIITEHILNDGEKYYPIYEDSEMGLVYFYDEDIVDVEVPSSNGKTAIVKKKKITQKQVKATSYYKQLANVQQKVEYFEGSSVLSTKKATEFTEDAILHGQLSVYNVGLGSEIVAEAENYLGVPYLWGGTTTSGFDCSGLVQYVYNKLGISLPRVSQQQYLVGTPLTRDELLPGDLVFFSDNGDVHHVGIYIGNGMMIHAPYTGAVVQYQSIDTGHYKEEFCGGRRVY